MEHFVYNSLMSWKTEEDRGLAICGYMQFHVPFIVLSKINTAILNCTDNYDVAKIKVKSVTDHQ